MLGIIVSGVGILAVILCIVLRRKIVKEWLFSCLACGILIFFVGGIIITTDVDQKNHDKENAYVALMYMNNNRMDEASFYIDNIQNDLFETICVDILLEYCKGNDELGQLKYDELRNRTKKEKELSILRNLKDISSEDVGILGEKISYLMENLSISEKRKMKADMIYAINNGSVNNEQLKLEEKEILYNRVNQYLIEEQYGSAVEEAASLVDISATKKNRLLLAETIAQATYGNIEIREDMFQIEKDKEKTKLNNKIFKLEEELNVLEEKLSGNISDGQREKLEEEKNTVLIEKGELEEKLKYLYVHRAFNSIRDIKGLDADIVRSRLYFSMRDPQKAMENLMEVSDSINANLESRSNIKNALNALNITFNEEDSIGGQSKEFQEAMITLLSASDLESVAIRTSALTKDFANHIQNEQKNYGKKLYITGFDNSNFPEITVVINGKQTIIQNIKDKKEDIRLRDTRKEIQDYIVIEQDKKDVITNVCCIIDQSGSMGGQPIFDLKEALVSFIEALDGNIQLSIVGFSNDSELLFPMSNNFTDAKNIASGIGIKSGTNITTGIQGGIDACETIKDGSKIFLLMTDGQSDIDMGVVEDAREKGCIIHTIGFGDVNDQLLQNIADMTGGQYIKAESSDELTNIYLSLAGTIGNSVILKYTAVDTETIFGRYVYVHSETEKTSLRYEYSRRDNMENKEDLHVENTWEELLAQGQEISYRRYQVGQLKIDTNKAALLDDGILVLGGNNIRFYDEAETLAVSLNGYVCVKVSDEIYSKLLMNEMEDRDTILLGNAGVLEGNGNIEVKYNDSAYEHGGFTQILEGDFEIEYDAVQAKIKQK